MSVWNDYLRGVEYNNAVGLYSTVETNENFFIGKQWEGVVSNGLPTPVFNFIKRVVNFLVASVSADRLAIRATARGAQAAEQAVNDALDAIVEETDLGSLVRRMVRNAAVDGDGCIYAYWDAEAGGVRAETLENTRVIFGDPNEKRVRKQPYIIIVSREDAEKARARAFKYGSADAVAPDGDETEIDFFIAHHDEAGYETPDDILTWPAHGEGDYAANLAPFVDVDGNGHYDPEAGDYPDIKGDQCLYFIFNDSYKNHTESGGSKIGLEIHAMIYAYSDSEDEALNNTVFVNYQFFNRSANDYHDVYLGLWSDFDIGYGWDDYIGCDVLRGSYFAYNGTPIDGYGEPESYGENPPVQVLTILAGPYMDADGRDNPKYNGDCDALFNETHPADKYAYNGFNFGNGIADDERLGMTGFLYHNNSSAINGDPSTAPEYYNFMRGIWKNGNHMQYGGNGYEGPNVVGPECNFMFPGDSDPCNFGTNGIAPNEEYNTGDKFWTEDECQNIPNDRRGVGLVGPFSFNAGSTQVIDYAMITVWNNESLSAIERKGDFIDHIRDLFNHGFSK